MKTIWLTFLAALFIPQAAGATSWNHRDNYQIKLHFGNDYFGKKVTGVYAHAGILKIDDQCGKKGRPYWDPASVKHVELSRKEPRCCPTTDKLYFDQKQKPGYSSFS